MKRFFSFLLLVLVLSMTVAALQVWKVRREGGSLGGDLRRWFGGSAATERRAPEHYTLAQGPRIDPAEVNVLAAMSRQRVALAKAVVPSVVSITTSKSVTRSSSGDDPIFNLFHPGFGRGGQSGTQKSLGSGVIVSKEGHIVTNNHVIDGMDEIEVELSDSRRRPARLIGTDPDTDIAVLKIEAGELVPIPFGNSEQVEVGETVMAVGNPYGFQESVTQGMISATNRHDSENSSTLFQTDAAINPGNSGGPLINVRGELIGINEAIFSESGGWQGVGFAIPSDTVRRVMDAILHTGRVLKSYLGVNLQGPLTPAIVDQQGLPSDKGALIGGVLTGSPAEAAHLRKGDFIQKFNGKPVNDFEELRRLVAEVEINKTVPVEFVRDGKSQTVDVTIAEMPPQSLLAQQSQRRGLQQPPGNPFLPPSLRGGDKGNGFTAREGVLGGVNVLELDSPFGHHLRLPSGVKGVLVLGIDANSLAADKLQPGDLIEAINQRPIASLADYKKAAVDLPTDSPAALSILRGRQRLLVILGEE